MKCYSSNQIAVCYGILQCVILAGIWCNLERSLERQVCWINTRSKMCCTEGFKKYYFTFFFPASRWSRHDLSTLQIPGVLCHIILNLDTFSVLYSCFLPGWYLICTVIRESFQILVFFLRNCIQLRFLLVTVSYT